MGLSFVRENLILVILMPFLRTSLKQTFLFLYTPPLLYTSVSCFLYLLFLLFSQVWFQTFAKLPLRCPLRHIYIYSDVTLP
jgi:hypothetical protein